MTASEADHKSVIRQLEERNVLFVNILFTDALGELKSVEIPIMQFKGALDSGISFDGSSIRGYADIANADMYLKPDLATLKIYPWATLMTSQEGRYSTASVIADPYTHRWGSLYPQSSLHLETLLTRGCQAGARVLCGR